MKHFKVQLRNVDDNVCAQGLRLCRAQILRSVNSKMRCHLIYFISQQIQPIRLQETIVNVSGFHSFFSVRARVCAVKFFIACFIASMFLTIEMLHLCAVDQNNMT